MHIDNLVEINEAEGGFFMLLFCCAMKQKEIIWTNWVNIFSSLKCAPKLCFMNRMMFSYTQQHSFRLERKKIITTIEFSDDTRAFIVNNPNFCFVLHSHHTFVAFIQFHFNEIFHLVFLYLMWEKCAFIERMCLFWPTVPLPLNLILCSIWYVRIRCRLCLTRPSKFERKEKVASEKMMEK